MANYQGRHDLIGSGGHMPPTPARGIVAGESVIEAVAVFAEVKVIAPPYPNVECDGGALMGEFGFKKSKRDDASLLRPDPDAPLVRVIGSAYMASVTVRVKPEKKTPRGRTL